MRLQALKLKLNDQSEVYGNYKNISQNQEKDMSSQEYTKDLPMQIKQNNFDNYSPVLQKNMEESNIQNLDQESILEQSDLPKHSQMKIGHYRKKSSRPNIFEPLLYKEEQMPCTKFANIF